MLRPLRGKIHRSTVSTDGFHTKSINEQQLSLTTNEYLQLRKMAEKKEKEGEEKKSLPQMVPKHHWECNKEWWALLTQCVL